MQVSLLKEKINKLMGLYFVEVTVDVKILSQGLRVYIGMNGNWLLLFGQAYSSFSFKE